MVPKESLKAGAGRHLETSTLVPVEKKSSSFLGRQLGDSGKLELLPHFVGLGASSNCAYFVVFAYSLTYMGYPAIQRIMAKFSDRIDLSL